MTERILVVEDEAIIARDIRQQLEQLGYAVAGHVRTGEEALEIAAESRPDLILMDIHLAGTIDGVEAAQFIRKELAIPVVFLTAFAGAEMLERAKITEPFGFIIKPFDERYLRTVIEMALFKHGAELRLRRAYDEQAIILRTALDGFFMADWQGRLLDVNEASCAILGYSREELLNMSLADLEPGLHGAKAQGSEGMKHATSARFEREHRRRDGSRVFLEMSVTYLPHAGGRIFCFARDITDRKRAEAAMARINDDLEARVAERTRDLDVARNEAESANRAKAAFLATMTHELRTPLNGILGTLDALKQTSLESDQLEMLDLLGESASSLLTVVDDILDYSKIEAGRLGLEASPVSVRDVVEKSCAVILPIAEKARVELTMFTDPAIPEVLTGDPVRLRQIVLNLASNAIKFSSQKPQPGKVSVRAMLSSTTAKDATVVIELKDNGIGMTEETIGQLFQSFSQADPSITRRFGGTGLGLAICRSLVDLMGGDISVTSEPGKGSTFRITLTLPLAQAEPGAGIGPDLGGLSCLVIGDGEVLPGDLVAYLEATGASVDRVPNLERARQHATEHPVGLWIWIVDVPGTPPTIESVRAAASGDARDTRFVLLGRGRRRRIRSLPSGEVVLDANVLPEATFLQAVLVAAGRAEASVAAIPLARRPAPRVPPTREEAHAAGRLILVAEDNDVNQQVILRQISLLGHVADVVSGGREAIERWHTDDYALLLADLHMPEMDGYQLTAAIRVQEPPGQHAVIIAVTADVLHGGTQQFRDMGFDDYLSKPVRLAELKAMLEKWMPQAARPRSSGPASAEPTALRPPVDVGVLQELVGRDQGVVEEFLRAFWISSAKTASELKNACRGQEASLVADLAHRAKSPARSVGALQLAEYCEQLERAGNARDFAAIAEIFPRFEQEEARVLAYLRER